MPHVIDLGAGPTNEDCAQLGQSPDFDALNRLEIATYKCALIARYGAPPPGCRLAALSNAHDFGRYVTLVLHIDDETDEAVCAYAEQVEEGLGTWLEAGFSAPVIHDGETPRIVHPDSTAAVVSALLITRHVQTGASRSPISRPSTPTLQAPSRTRPRPHARVCPTPKAPDRACSQP